MQGPCGPGAQRAHWRCWTSGAATLPRPGVGAVNQLRVLLRALLPGGAPRVLSAAEAEQLLECAVPAGPAEITRHTLAAGLIAQVRTWDMKLKGNARAMASLVAESGSRLTGTPGIGAVTAACLLGRTGKPTRFPTSSAFAQYLNLLHKHINQGHAEGERSHISARRLARMLLTRPHNLKAGHRDLLDRLTAACPEMTHLATTVRTFAPLLKPQPEKADALERWINQVRTTDLPHLHAFSRGLERDRSTVIAAVTLPYSNGPTEGINTKTKRMARQIHGRAGFTLLRHGILLA